MHITKYSYTPDLQRLAKSYVGHTWDRVEAKNDFRVYLLLHQKIVYFVNMLLRASSVPQVTFCPNFSPTVSPRNLKFGPQVGQVCRAHFHGALNMFFTLFLRKNYFLCKNLLRYLFWTSKLVFCNETHGTMSSLQVLFTASQQSTCRQFGFHLFHSILFV